MPSWVVLGMFGGGSWLPKCADNPLLEQGAHGGAVQHHLYEQGESKPLGQVQVSPLKPGSCNAAAKRLSVLFLQEAFGCLVMG